MSYRPYQQRGRGGGGGGGGRGGGYWRGGGAQSSSSNRPKLDRIEYGLAALIFTMDVADERPGVREAMNLVDYFLPKLDPPHADEPASATDQDAKGDGEDEDVSDVLKELCEKTKQGEAPGQRTVKQLDIGTKHTMFLSIDALSADKLYRLVDLMVDECQKVARCRFLSRCIPVEDVCSAAGNLAGETTLSIPIADLIRRHVELYAAESGSGAPSTYAVEFKVRNSSSPITKEDVYKMVDAAVKEHAPECRVNLTEPDIQIIIGIYRSLAMLSCVRRYLQRRSFSLRLPTEKSKQGKGDNDGGEGSTAHGEKKAREDADGGEGTTTDGEKKAREDADGEGKK